MLLGNVGIKIILTISSKYVPTNLVKNYVLQIKLLDCNVCFNFYK